MYTSNLKSILLIMIGLFVLSPNICLAKNVSPFDHLSSFQNNSEADVRWKRLSFSQIETQIKVIENQDLNDLFLNQLFESDARKYFCEILSPNLHSQNRQLPQVRTRTKIFLQNVLN